MRDGGEDALLERWNACGYYRTMGMRAVRADPAGSELTLEVLPGHTQLYGTAHGGVVAGLLDAAMGIAAIGGLPEGEGCTTIEMKVNFTGPAPPGGLLRARGRVLHAGRRIVVAAAEAHADGDGDGEGRMVACAQGTFQRIAERPS